MRRRLLGALAGAALVALALWIVGLEDRVTDASGGIYRGRLLDDAPSGTVVLRTAEGDRVFDAASLRSVRPGLLSAFRRLAARPELALLGVVVHLLSILFVHLRWGVLLRAAGLKVPLPAVLRLGWIGQFAASMLPGGIATGDVVKAFYVTGQATERRATAVSTVVFDRLLGLIVLSTIALLGALFARGSTRVGGTRAVLAMLLGGGLLLLLLLFSPRLRTATGLPALAARLRLPFLREAGQAFALYREEGRAIRVAVCLALLSQSLVLLALFLYGKALGVTMSLFAVAAAIPVAQMVSAVPGLPGGFGMGDLAFVALLPDAGVPAATALALSFTYKTAHLLIALPAGFWLRGRPPP